MSVTLSGEWAVYVGQEKMGRLSTIDPDGMPSTTPVFYALIDNELYFGTQKRRKKYRNLQRDAKLCFTIDTPTAPYKGIMIQGHARFVDDPAIMQRWHDALMYRYYGHRDSASWQYIQSLGNPGLVKIDIARIFQWDLS